MAILHCKVVVNALGVKQYVRRAIEGEKSSTLFDDDVVAYNVFPRGDKIDMRAHPPFLAILPCPHCGTTNDRKHDLARHVDPKHGVNEVETQAVMLEHQCSVGVAYQGLTIKGAG